MLILKNHIHAPCQDILYVHICLKSNSFSLTMNSKDCQRKNIIGRFIRPPSEKNIFILNKLFIDIFLT